MTKGADQKGHTYIITLTCSRRSVLPYNWVVVRKEMNSENKTKEQQKKTTKKKKGTEGTKKKKK